jgi:hypothetical protein
MLAKCANPACSATFRYFHEGRLFVFEPKRDAPKRWKTRQIAQSPILLVVLLMLFCHDGTT